MEQHYIAFMRWLCKSVGMAMVVFLTGENLAFFKVRASRLHYSCQLVLKWSLLADLKLSWHMQVLIQALNLWIDTTFTTILAGLWCHVDPCSCTTAPSSLVVSTFRWFVDPVTGTSAINWVSLISCSLLVTMCGLILAWSVCNKLVFLHDSHELLINWEAHFPVIGWTYL